MTDQEKVDLWFSFLFSGLAMLNSDTLDLESSSQNRKKVVLEQAGDIRDEICRDNSRRGALWATGNIR